MVAKISTQHSEKLEQVEAEFNKKIDDLSQKEKELRELLDSSS